MLSLYLIWKYNILKNRISFFIIHIWIYMLIAYYVIEKKKSFFSFIHCWILRFEFGDITIIFFLSSDIQSRCIKLLFNNRINKYTNYWLVTISFSGIRSSCVPCNIPLNTQGSNKFIGAQSFGVYRIFLVYVICI